MGDLVMKKFIDKILYLSVPLKVAIICIVLYFFVHTFNHGNPWIGLFGSIADLFIGVKWINYNNDDLDYGD